jgi:hypothetical protein
VHVDRVPAGAGGDSTRRGREGQRQSRARSVPSHGGKPAALVSAADKPATKTTVRCGAGPAQVDPRVRRGSVRSRIERCGRAPKP